MTVFKPIETYADQASNHTYKNSREAVLRLPFPYPEDQYMCSITSRNATTVHRHLMLSRASTTQLCHT